MRDAPRPGGPVTTLHGMAWDHQRGIGCLRAVSAAYTATRPDLSITWDSRSLREFEDVPVAELAARYDLVAMDHPYVGQAHATSALVPLGEILPAAVLEAQRTASVGPSHASYTWGGGQWAVAMDAAAQVSAYRPDLLAALGWDAPPRSWDGVIELMEAMPAGRAVLPANPTHLLCALLTLCSQEAGGRSGWLGPEGFDPEVAVPASERLLRLLALAGPSSLELDPIGVLDRMSGGDDVAYAPIVFGYVNYARPEAGRRGVRFAGIPSPDGGPAGSLLGGVGLAVSARSREPEAAARFLEHVVGSACQRGEYVRSGGQPGNRDAWTDPAVDAANGGFFSGTLATLDRAFVRPRDPVYPLVHKRVGDELHRLAGAGAGAAELAARASEVCAATYAEHGR
ncbi:ABC transporter substrate-binding protein [Actinomadura xylanilytica]|uniref:ABC transporter substrate-binding protein n=1 Tax=Actinomadura xylanilytica TaxID=887459 RepID=UPI00255AA8B2|nr:ABC transporter substrate-binding protein [Actinomadura xylanilytica]MDL4776522.1 ABC transporter substrate-binding protein [Actinomadura xylanilytica]